MSNLPPGVTTNMIPGNRPEDIAAEAFQEELGEVTGNLLPDDVFEKLCLWLDEKMGAAYSSGYEDGRFEAQMEQAQKEESDR